MFKVVAFVTIICSASSSRVVLEPKVLQQVAEKFEGKPDLRTLIIKDYFDEGKAVEAKGLQLQSTPAEHQPIWQSDDLGWLNALLHKIWPQATEAINEIVKTKVNPLLASTLPGPLPALELKPFTFSTAPVLGPVKVYESRDGIKMKLAVHFETSQSITMSAGSGFTEVSAGIASFSFGGQLVVHLAPIIGTAPVIGGLRVYFIDPPQVDVHFSGLASVAEIPVVGGLVRNAINKAISHSLVLPNVLGIPLATPEQGVDPSFLDQPEAIGIVRVKILKARDLPNMDLDLLGFVSDPYVTVKMGDNSWSSPVVESNLNPDWTEGNSHDFVVYDREQTIGFSVYDSDLLTKDDFFGKVIPMKYGESVGRTWNASLLKDGKTGVGSLLVAFEELDVVKCHKSMTGLLIQVDVESISLPASLASAASALVTINGTSKPTGVGRMPVSATPVLQDVVRRMHERPVPVPVNLISEYTGLTEVQVNNVIEKLSGGHGVLHLHIGSKLYFPNIDFDIMAVGLMTIEVLDQNGVRLAEHSLNLAQLQLLEGVGTKDGCMRSESVSVDIEGGEKILIRGTVDLLSYRQVE
mmetsp:Transcript_42136/g.75400  ORF Transcript_42136/g.75400 Transcript_42136/m.75400 type:complete len:580 (+) Transcript_42136:37-1776(+)